MLCAVVSIARTPTTFAIPTALSLLFILALLPAPATGTADSCQYLVTGAPATPSPTTGPVFGPWPNTVPGIKCGGLDFKSTALPCAGTMAQAPGGGAWCDLVYTGFPPPPFRQCTVVVPALPGVTVTGIAAGWDITGSATGGPDGNVDFADLPYNNGVATNIFPGPMPPGSMVTVPVYPPPGWGAPDPVTGAPLTTAQLIAYPVAGSAILPATAVALQVGCF